jgi:predicted O-methyltransferase YrrM
MSDKQIYNDVVTTSINIFEDVYDLNWQMSQSERFCLITLLEKIKPEIAIEIGTSNGGSLQVISKYAKKVYAIDIDPTVIDRLGSKFKNVEFLIGDSKIIIPKLITELQENNKSIEFALIDGDHSSRGVQLDIENILKYVPLKSLTIIMHDSFNPKCRKGMLAPSYNEYKHVHYVEIDYISGGFILNNNREMWGGFGKIILLAKARSEQLKIGQSQKELFRIAYLYSIHFIKNSPRILRPIIKFLYK